MPTISIELTDDELLHMQKHHDRLLHTMARHYYKHQSAKRINPKYKHRLSAFLKFGAAMHGQPFEGYIQNLESKHALFIVENIANLPGVYQRYAERYPTGYHATRGGPTPEDIRRHADYLGQVRFRP